MLKTKWESMPNALGPERKHFAFSVKSTKTELDEQCLCRHTVGVMTKCLKDKLSKDKKKSHQHKGIRYGYNNY